MICRPNVLEFGAVGREIVDRLVTTLFDMLLLLLGERFVTTRLELLPTGRLTVLLGVRLVMTLLERKPLITGQQLPMF